MSNFLDIINGFRKDTGQAELVDPLADRTAEKQARLTEKQQELAPKEIPLTGTSSNDGDNINHVNLSSFGLGEDKNIRIQGSDGAFGAWETKKPASFYNNPVYGKQRTEQVRRQALRLDIERELPAGTSTFEDVWAKGADAHAKFVGNLYRGNDQIGQGRGRTRNNNKLAPKPTITFAPDPNGIDQSQKGGDGKNRRVLGQVFNKLGENVGDISNTREINPDFDSKFNQPAKDRAEQAKLAKQASKDRGQLFSDETLRTNPFAVATNVGAKLVGALGKAVKDTALTTLKSQSKSLDKVINKEANVDLNDGIDGRLATGLSKEDRRQFFKFKEAEKKVEGSIIKDSLKSLSPDQIKQFRLLSSKEQEDALTTGLDDYKKANKEAFDKQVLGSLDKTTKAFVQGFDPRKVAQEGRNQGKKDLGDSPLNISFSGAVTALLGDTKDDSTKGKAFNTLNKIDQIDKVLEKADDPFKDFTRYTALPFVHTASKNVTKNLRASVKDINDLKLSDKFSKGTLTADDVAKASILMATGIGGLAKGLVTPENKGDSVIAQTLGLGVEVAADSLIEMALMAVTRGMHAINLFSDIDHRNAQAFKKAHKGDSLDGFAQFKSTSYGLLETAIRAGAAEFAAGRLIKGLGGSKSGKEVNDLFSNLQKNGMPNLKDKELSKFYQGSNKSSLDRVGAINKELNTLKTKGETLDRAFTRVSNNSNKTSFSGEGKIAKNIQDNKKAIKVLEKEKTDLGKTISGNSQNSRELKTSKGNISGLNTPIDKLQGAIKIRKDKLAQLKSDFFNKTLTKTEQKVKGDKIKIVEANIAKLEGNVTKFRVIQGTERASINKTINDKLGAKVVADLKPGTQKLLKHFKNTLGIPPVRLITSILRAGKIVAVGGATEFGEEFSEELLGQLASNIDTDKQLDFEKAIVAGSIGFAGGASFSAPLAIRQEGLNVAGNTIGSIGTGVSLGIKATSIAAKIVNTLAIKPTGKLLGKLFPNTTTNIDKAVGGVNTATDFVKAGAGKVKEAAGNVDVGGLVDKAKDLAGTAANKTGDVLKSATESLKGDTTNNPGKVESKDLGNILSSDITTSIRDSTTIQHNDGTSTSTYTVNKEDSVSDLEYLIGLESRGKLTEQRLLNNKTILANSDTSSIGRLKESLANGTIADTLNTALSNINSNNNDTTSTASTSNKSGKTFTDFVTTRDVQSKKDIIKSDIADVKTADLNTNINNAATNIAKLNNDAVVAETMTTRDFGLLQTHLDALQESRDVLFANAVDKTLPEVVSLEETISDMTGVLVRAGKATSFSDVDTNNTTSTLFRLNPKDQKNKNTLTDALDKELKANPDNKVAKTGKALSDTLDSGFVNNTNSEGFQEVLDTLSGFSGVATQSKDNNQFSAVKGVQDIINGKDTQSLNIVAKTIEAFSKDTLGKLKKVQEFITKGDTNATFDLDGKSYKLGGEVEALRTSLENEANFIGQVNDYFDAVINSDTTKGRSVSTSNSPLNVRSGDTTTKLQTDLARLNKISNKSDTVLQDIDDIKTELSVRNVKPNSKSKLKTGRSIHLIGSNKLISTHKGSQIAKNNPTQTNNNSFERGDVIGVDLQDSPTTNDIKTTLNKLKLVIKARARVVGVGSIKDKKARSEIETLLRESGYIKNKGKFSTYFYSDASLKGTLANDANGVATKIEEGVLLAETRSYKEANIQTVQDAVSWALKHSPDSITTSLLRAMQSKINDSGLSVEVVTGTSRVNANGVKSSPRGNVSFIKNSKGEVTGVKLFINSKTGGYKSVVHELLHVATVQQLYSEAGKENLDKIDAILKQIKSDPKIASLGKIYGLTNQAEFLAELSNPKFRALLDKVTLESKPDSKGIILTALEAVKKVFKDALGAIIGTSQEYTALDAGLEVLDSLLDNGLSLEANNLLNENNPIRSKNKRVLSKFRDNLRDPNLRALMAGEDTEVETNFHRTNKFKLNNFSLRELATDTFGLKFLYKNKTTFAFGDLNPLKNNIDVNPSRVGSIFSLLPKGIRSLNEVQSLFELNDKELKYVGELSQYVQEFQKSLDKVMPDMSKIKKDNLARILKEAPILGFYTNNSVDSMDVTIKDAMAMASRVWLSEDAKQNSFNDNTAMHKILGNSNHSPKLPTAASESLQDIGIEQGQAIERLGNIFIAMMPLKALEGADGALIQKIKNSAAMYMLSAMADRNEVKFKEETNGELDQWRQTQSDNKNAVVHFVKPNLNIDSNGKATSKTDIVKNKERDHEFRHVRSGITGVDANLQMPSDEAITPEDIEEAENLSLTKTSKTMKKAILANGQIPYHLNESQHKLTERLGESAITEMLQGDQTKLNHSYYENSAKGKNLSVQDAQGNLSTWIESRAETGLSIYDKPIFMLHRVWNNIRMGITNNAINFQASKYHRYMFGAKDWYYDFNINDTNDTVSYVDNEGNQRTVTRSTLAKRNILQGLGFKDNLELDNVDATFQELLANINNNKVKDTVNSAVKFNAKNYTVEGIRKNIINNVNNTEQSLQWFVDSNLHPTLGYMSERLLKYLTVDKLNEKVSFGNSLKINSNSLTLNKASFNPTQLFNNALFNALKKPLIQGKKAQLDSIVKEYNKANNTSISGTELVSLLATNPSALESLDSVPSKVDTTQSHLTKLRATITNSKRGEPGSQLDEFLGLVDESLEGVLQDQNTNTPINNRIININPKGNPKYVNIETVLNRGTSSTGIGNNRLTVDDLSKAEFAKLQNTGFLRGEDGKPLRTKSESNIDSLNKFEKYSVAIDAINSTGDLTTKQKNAILDTIATAGGKTRSLNALNNLAAFKLAMEGNGKVKNMMLPHEIDGITNGTAISLMQLPFNVEQAKDILRATGVFFEGDPWNSAEEFKADPKNKDNYESLTNIAISLLNMQTTASFDSNGNEILSLDISQYAALNGVIMPTMLKSDGTVSKEGRDFTKDFLMTYIYSKGDKARLEDIKTITIDNIYSKLAELDALFNEGIQDTDIFGDDVDHKYTRAKNELKDLNDAINGMRKQAVENRKQLANAVNKLIRKDLSRAKGRRNDKERKRVEREIRTLMINNAYLLPRGAYNFNVKNPIETNFANLVKFVKSEAKQPIENVFDTKSITSHEALFSQRLPADVELLLANVASKVYGVAINQGLSQQLGDFQHSRSLMNQGIRYASQVSFMIFEARRDKAKKVQAISQGLDPNTDVNLSRKQVKDILVDMAKSGELHTIKHASSSKGIKSHVDSLLIMSEKLTVQKNAEGRVRIPLQNKITRETPSNTKTDPKNKRNKNFKQYSTMAGNISNYEMDPDIGVKGSVNLTHAFDGNIQGAMMATGESMSNNHDAKIIGAMEAINSEEEYNQKFYEQNINYSMYTEVEHTVLRAYRTFLEFQKSAGKDSKYIKTLESTLFVKDIRKGLKVPLMHDTTTDAYVVKETKDLDGNTIELSSVFKNGLEVVSAVSTEAAHIRENSKKLNQDIEYLNQYSNIGQSHYVSQEKKKAQEDIDITDINGLKALIKHNANQEDALVDNDISKFFEFDDPDVDVNTELDNINISNPINNRDSFGTDVSGFNTIGNTVLSVDTLTSTTQSLEKIDKSNNITISDSHNNTLDSFFSGSGKDLLSLTTKVNVKLANTQGTSTSVAIAKGTIHINTGEAILNSNNPIGAKEALAHGMSSLTWGVLRKVDKATNRELFTIFNTVLSGKDPITYKDFLKVPEEESSQQDIDSAKQFFKDVFDAKNIEAFAAFASTNEMMIEAISRFKIPEVLKDSKTGTLTNTLQRIFASGMNFLFSKDVTADVRIQELATNINHLNDKSIINSLGLDGMARKVNTAFGNTVVDKAYRPYAKLVDSLHKNNINRFDVTQKDKDRGLTKIPVLLFKMTGNVTLTTLSLSGKLESIPQLGKMFQEMTANHNNWLSTVAHDLVTEVRGAEVIERDYYKILRHAKYYNESSASKAKNGFIKQYDSMFDKNKIPTNEDQESFTKALIKTDIQSIIPLFKGEKYLAKVLTSTSTRDALKARLYNELKPIAGNRLAYYKFHAENLGSYLTNKTFTTHGLMKNANHIANLRNINDISIRRKADKLSKSDLQQAESLINHIATLEALDHVSKHDKQVSADFILNEANKKDGNESAIGFLVHHHAALQAHNQELNRKDNSKHQTNKGYTHEVRTTNTDVQVGLINKDKDLLEDSGYLLHNKLRVGAITLGVYYNKSSNAQRYQTGIMSINSKNSPTSLQLDRVIKDRDKLTTFRAITQNNTNKESASLLLGRSIADKSIKAVAPNLNDSDINDIPFSTFELNDGATGAINALQSNAGTIIGNTLGNNVTVDTSPKYNKQLIEVIERDFKENFKENPEEFILVSKDKGSSKQRESLTRMPVQIVRALEETFGENKPIYVRRSTFNSAFGFTKMSAVNGSLLNALEDNGVAKRLFLHTERLWQAVVAKSKTNSIIYNPKTLAANTFSNGVVLAAKGIPPNLIFKYQKEALVSAIRYRRVSKDKADLERKVLAFKKYKGRDTDKLRVKQLQRELESSSIHDMVSDGLLQSVVEDVATTESPIIDTLDTAIKAFTPNGKGYINDGVSKLTSTASSSLPISPVSAIKNLIITEDTDLASALRDATQYSDFIARYALIKHRQSEGVNRKEAIEEALDTFIDYDVHTSPLIQYANDMGIIQYTKFFFRVQRVILEQIKNNPANTVALAAAQLALGDAPDITDSNLAHGAYVPTVGSIVDNAFGLNLLKWIPFI